MMEMSIIILYCKNNKTHLYRDFEKVFYWEIDNTGTNMKFDIGKLVSLNLASK